MEINSIFLIILLLAASALCISLIIYFNRITKSIKNIEDDIKQISNDIKPLIVSGTELSDKINSLTDNANDQVDTVKSIILIIKERLETIFDFEERIRGGLEEPAMSLIKNLSAFYNGVSKFIAAYKRNNSARD
jgi:uncharacterized protein YoxC